MRLFGNILAVLLVSAVMVGCSQPDGAAQKKQAEPKVVVQPPKLPAQALKTLDQLEPPVVFEPAKNTLPPTKEIHADCMRLYIKGKSLQSRGKLDEAIDVFQRALMINSEDSAVMKQLGLSYLGRGKLDKAIDFLQRAVLYRPDDLQLQVSLGRAYLLRNKSQAAIYCFRSALKTKQASPAKPETAFAILYLGRLLEKDGYYTAALECFDRLRLWVKDNWKQYQKDRVLKELVLKPERFMIARGRLLVKLQRPAEALIEYKRAYSRDRENVNVGKKYFDLLIGQGDYKKAEKLLVRFTRQSSYDLVVGKMAKQLCEKSGDKAMPMRIWKRYRNKNQVCSGLAISLADAAADMGLIEEAQQLLVIVLRETVDCPEAAEKLALLKIKQGQGAEALERTVEIIQDNPGARESVNAAVGVIAASPDGKKMYTDMVAGIDRSSPKDVYKMYVAAIMARKLDDFADFNSLLNDAVKADPKFASAYIELLQSQWALENQKKTNTLLGKMKTQVGGPLYYYTLGAVELNRGQTSDALDNLEKSREQNPDSAQTLVKLSKAYKRQARKMPGSPHVKKMRKISETLLIKAIELRPSDPKAYRELFADYLARKNPKNAAIVAAKFIRNIPDNPEGTIMAVDTYLLDGRRKRASRLVEKLLKEHPDNPRVELLDVRWILSKYRGVLPKDVFDSSAKKLDEIISRKQPFPKALQLYARLLTRPVPGDYVKAAEVYGKLYALDIHDFDVAAEYAKSLLRAKQYLSARKLLVTLRKTSPGDYLLKRLYVETYIGMGDKAAAEKLLSQWTKSGSNLARKLFAQNLLKLYIEDRQTNKALSLLDSMEHIKGVGKDFVQKERVIVLLNAKRYDQAVKYATGLDSKIMLGMILAELKGLATPECLTLAMSIVDDNLAKADNDKDKKHWQLQKLAVIAAGGKKDIAKFKAAADALVKEYPKEYDIRQFIYYTAQHFKFMNLARDYLNAWRNDFYDSEDFGDKEKQFIRWCRRSLVSLLMSENKYSKANNLLDQFLAEDGGTASFAYQRSMVYSEIGQTKRALEFMKKALLLEKTNPVYMNDFAYQLSIAGVELKKAEKLSRRCIQKLGFKPTYIDTLAWVLYKRGKFSRSAELFLQIVPTPAAMAKANTDKLRAALLEDEHPVMLEHAGDALYRLGWKKLAGKYWRAAVDVVNKGKYKDRETINVLDSASGKLKALEKGTPARVAPLGKDVELDMKGIKN